jgi:hypothetical protein
MLQKPSREQLGLATLKPGERDPPRLVANAAIVERKSLAVAIGVVSQFRFKYKKRASRATGPMQRRNR